LKPIDSPLLLGHLKLNPARIPFLRRIVGLQWVAITQPSHFQLYEEAPRHPASKAATPGD
jgi:hypothetical protein